MNSDFYIDKSSSGMVSSTLGLARRGVIFPDGGEALDEDDQVISHHVEILDGCLDRISHT